MGFRLGKIRKGGWSLLVLEKVPFSLRQEGKENVE